MKGNLLVLMALGLVGAVVGLDKSFSGSGLTCQIKGRSGKIAIFPTDKDASAGVVIDIDALQEVDLSGAVTKSKDNINSFATADFTFGDNITDVQLDGNAGNKIDAKQLDFTAPVGTDGGLLKISTFIISTEGLISTGSDSLVVKPGSLKFNVELTNYPFTNDGSAVMLQINVKGSKDKPEKVPGKDGEKKLKADLGGSATAEFPADYTIGGVASVMPEGFPKIVTQGAKTVIQFKFAKGGNILYDPTINGANVAGSAHAISVSLLSALATALFFF